MYALKKEIFQKKRSTARTWSHGASLCGSGGPYHHVVDLDGALAGKSENLSAIKAILREGGISIEVGGGIRTYEQIEGLLSLGVSQVILALPPSMIPACGKGQPGFSPQNRGRIDAKNGYAAADGWEKDSNLTAEALARRVAAAGTERIILRHQRDG